MKPRSTIFSLPFLLVWGVFGATYMTANLLDIYNERKSTDFRKAVMTKLVGTTAVNMATVLTRDV